MEKLKRNLRILLLCCLGIAGWEGAFAQNIVTVSGTVTSAEDHLPLIGVTVIAGPTNATTTNADGAYTLSVVPGSMLIFQYIGYKKEELVVPGGGVNYSGTMWR